MMRFIPKSLRKVARNEDGTATLEFVLVAPLLVSFIIFSVELGIVTMQSAMLERGLDITVRDIRLGTGSAPQHDDIKDSICDNSFVIANCREKLRLEMVPTDLRNLAVLDPTPDCTDVEEPAKPLRAFIPGGQNQLMLLRACLKYEPIFPDAILGRALIRDTNGEAAFVAMSAFVQEPI
ncbi:TadE/TadG family type IV pilus assembly protein [Roseovarius sp. MBR-6]|jgi:hypothetical protein|uniref:TadE/TadG family type IV pilus assembly protein n=1 Tax=Roseovarius sp. MBR-6 TaxID=3156459 RepID=UPI00339AC52C